MTGTACALLQESNYFIRETSRSRVERTLERKRRPRRRPPRRAVLPAGDFHIDPWRPVDRAVITHAHADHARVGHRHYLASAARHRRRRCCRGARHRTAKARLRRADRINGVTVSLHPAGHVLGSAQVRIEHGGRVWVASGDYKTEADPHLRAVRAGALRHLHHRIDLRPADLSLAARRHELFADIDAWWRANADAGARVGAVLLRLRQGAAHPARRRCGDRADRRVTARSSRSTTPTARRASRCRRRCASNDMRGVEPRC